MRIKINNYTFNKTNRTVTFTDYTSIRLDGISYIINATRNIVIYIFSSQNLGGSVINNILTLDYDTSLMDDNDKLEIYYDDEDTNQSTDESVILLRRIHKLLESNQTVDRSNRQRITIDAVQQIEGDISGSTIESAGTLPILSIPSGLLGYQAGEGYGQPVSGTSITVYTDSGYTYSNWDDDLSGYTESTYFDSGITIMDTQGTPYLTNTLNESWYKMRWEGPVDQRWRLSEDSRITYQTRIRSKLEFN